MSIKGTLETFNLCELLQMLAFNQKQGTLVLEAEGGTRTIFLDSGKLTVLEQDPYITTSILRLARRHQLGADGRLDRAIERHQESGRNLLSVMESMGLLDADLAAELRKEATLEQLFEAQLTSVAGFEFVEGQALTADRSDGVPVKPLLSVESLLLDLARMLDHWNTVSEAVPSPSEIYEGTGIEVDLADADDTDPVLAEEVVPLIDGFRSIGHIAETCHATPYAVMLIAAALHQDGGIRAVPTEDLMLRAEDQLVRGEAARALPLLMRCIERGDAPTDVRLRLADALEASGEPAAAAAELDTFAALSEEDEAPAVFEALSRALRLRDGDFPTAARVCDYYLRRRPWLQEYRTLATQALRDLIHGGTTGGRPTEAALRLQGFIECGDAPGEDLLLLADLFAAGGARKEAAAALYTRCEELMATDRTTAARQMLRRVLELDPGHADAHRRQSEMDGKRRRRGHRARIVMILILMLSIGGAAGFAWWTSRDSSSNEIVLSNEQALNAIVLGEKKSDELIAAFETRAQAAASAHDHDEGLGQAAAELLAAVKTTMAATQAQLSGYADEITRSEAFGYAREHKGRYEALMSRRHQAYGRAKAAVDELAGRARTSLALALKEHKDGQFAAARRQLREARNLAFNDPATLSDARRLLGLVDEYYERFELLRDQMVEQTDAGDLPGAFETGMGAVRELLDSDLTRKLPFPVKVTSSPAGAEVWLENKDTGLRTPCVFTYSVFVTMPTLHLRLPGHTHVKKRLPSFAQIRREARELTTWKPLFHGTLRPGARWAVGDPVSTFKALWSGGGMPLVAGAAGRTIYAAAPSDGRLVPGTRLENGQDPIQLGGRLVGGLEWLVRGHRTLQVQPPSGESWEVQASGRLVRAPLSIAGHLVVVDEIGVLYGFKAQSGDAVWRVELPGPPTQAPMRSAMGILIATTTGAVYRIDPKTGDAKPIAAAARGPAIALPLGEGCVVLGGGAGGCRYVDAAGTVSPRGDAQPAIDRPAWVSDAGVAWIASDGAYWLAKDAKAPVRLKGLGTGLEFLGGGDDGLLFATTASGLLRVIDLTKPKQALWSAPLGGRADAPPLRLGNAVYVLVAGRLVSIEV